MKNTNHISTQFIGSDTILYFMSYIGESPCIVLGRLGTRIGVRSAITSAAIGEQVLGTGVQVGLRRLHTRIQKRVEIICNSPAISINCHLVFYGKIRIRFNLESLIVLDFSFSC